MRPSRATHTAASGRPVPASKSIQENRNVSFEPFRPSSPTSSFCRGADLFSFCQSVEFLDDLVGNVSSRIVDNARPRSAIGLVQHQCETAGLSDARRHPCTLLSEALPRRPLFIGNISMKLL